MIGSLLGLVSSIVGGALSSASHDETQSKLAEMVSNNRVPESVRRGEAILREQAGTGLPGYQEQLSEIDSSIPMTLNEAKDYISGGGLVDALSKMYTQGNAAKRQLGRENDAAILANKNRLAQYLGSVSAGYENETQRRRDELEIGAINEGQAKTEDTINSIMGGIGAIAGGIGSEQGLMDMILGANKQTTTTPWRETADYFGKYDNSPMSLAGLSNKKFSTLLEPMETNTNTIDIINNIIRSMNISKV